MKEATVQVCDSDSGESAGYDFPVSELVSDLLPETHACNVELNYSAGVDISCRDFSLSLPLGPTQLLLSAH